MIGAELFRRRLMSMGRALDPTISRGYITAIYNITDLGAPTKLFDGDRDAFDFRLKMISNMWIDEVEVQPTKEMTFTSLGEHIVRIHLNGLFNDATRIFYDCIALKSADFTEADFSEVRRMSATFSGCSNLQSVSLGELYVPKLETMSVAFGYTGLKTIDFGRIDLSHVPDIQRMFYNSFYLTEIKMLGPINPNVNVTNLFSSTYSQGTFYYNSAYDYSRIIAQLPSTWTAVAVNS